MAETSYVPSSKAAAEVSPPIATIESVTRAAEYASDIAEIVLNLTVESMIG